jgi:hypothetical protein
VRQNYWFGEEGAVMEEVPKEFDYESETVPLLARVKKKAANKFAFTRQTSLTAGSDLAYWLFVFRRDREAAEVCRFLARAEFDGDFNLWSWVEEALVLLSRLSTDKREGKGCVGRVTEAGYEASRLGGALLAGRDGYRANIAAAVAGRDKSAERDWRLAAVKELCFVVALGGSKKLSSSVAESDLQNHLAALRSLVGVADAAPGTSERVGE